MKPSIVILLILVVAVIVALFSYNVSLAFYLALVLILGVATRLLRSGFKTPGEEDSESDRPRP